MFPGITISGFADEINPQLDKQIEVLKKLNMNHIEMRTVDGKPLISYSIDEAKEIKNRLDEVGFKLSSVGSSIGKYPIEKPFEEHMELFKHTVEIAHVMDTKNIRMFSFFTPEGQDADQFEGEVMKRTEQMIRYAEGEDVLLLHENEKGIYGDIAPRCLKLMENFYGDHYKAVFDFANFVQCNQDTLEAYEMMKPYIYYVHIKDALKKDASVVPAGHGDGHVKEILGKLKAAGYTGFLSLEPHLADFNGFSALGDTKSIKGEKLTGEEAFTLAHDSLIAILDTL